VLLVVFGVVGLLCVVFGVTVMRQKAQFQEYRDATLAESPPWAEGPMTIEQCVAHTVDWAMACPGVESWCFNEAPKLTRECLGSQDRRPACQALGDSVASTHFGYAECEAMRESGEGRYTKRSHKKFCAASYRAVAEYCRQTGGVAPNTAR
jgi:hypothetical protein